MPQIVITAIGPDKPGLVGELTGHLSKAGANILDSRMINLRGQFAVIMLAEVPEASCAAVKASLPRDMATSGLKIDILDAHAGKPPILGVPYRIKTYSMDQPGLVHKISDALRVHGVNIEELSTRQESAAFAGTPLFIMEFRITVPPEISPRKLRADLEKACESLNMDLDMEPG